MTRRWSGCWSASECRSGGAKPSSSRLEIRNCTNMQHFLSLLQFADGLFPAGAYAHSFGLETCVQSGEVRNAAGAEAFLHAFLKGSAGPTDALVVVCARRAAA